MKKTDTKAKRVKITTLNTEERLTVLANLIIDKLIEKYGTNLASSKT